MVLFWHNFVFKKFRTLFKINLTIFKMCKLKALGNASYSAFDSRPNEKVEKITCEFYVWFKEIFLFIDTKVNSSQQYGYAHCRRSKKWICSRFWYLRFKFQQQQLVFKILLFCFVRLINKCCISEKASIEFNQEMIGIIEELSKLGKKKF